MQVFQGIEIFPFNKEAFNLSLHKVSTVETIIKL